MYNQNVFKLLRSDVVCVSKVPKLADGQQHSESPKTLPDVVGPKKQVSYRTDIIGGVPIVTQTQVTMTYRCIAQHIHTGTYAAISNYRKHTHTLLALLF